jgi:hypothetical protein
MSVQEFTISAWRCQDGHSHKSKQAAEKCEKNKPARMRREAAEEDRKAQLLIRISQERMEQALISRWRKQQTAACRNSEVGTSDLEFRVAFALFNAGAVDRAKFRELFVTPENTLDLAKLSRVSGVTIDDYPTILNWINAAN